MVIGQAIQQYQCFALHLQFHIVVQKINYEKYGPTKNECLIEVNNSNLSKKGCGHLNRMQQLSFINWTCAWRSFGDLWSTRTWFLAIRNNRLIMQEEEYFQQYHDSAKESKANLVRKIKWQHFSSNKEYYLFHLWYGISIVCIACCNNLKLIAAIWFASNPFWALFPTENPCRMCSCPISISFFFDALKRCRSFFLCFHSWNVWQE